MGVLKGIGTFIFTFLFFLVLMVFCIAFIANSTVLSYDFVSNQVDKMPVSSIARDVAEDQLGGQLGSSDFLKEVAYRVIDNEEPWIKTQMNGALATGYDYFEGRTNYLSISISTTQLKSDLNTSFWQEARTYLSEELAGKSDAEITTYLQDIINDIPQDALASALTTMTVTQRNQMIEQYLRDAAGVPQKISYPPLDPGLKTQIDQGINQFINDFVNNINDPITWDESSIDAGLMDTFRSIRNGIGEFHKWYPWVIVLMVVLAGLIFLVNWGFKVPAISLGISLTIIGVVVIVGIILLRTLPFTQWAADAMNTNISPQLKVWIEGLISDVTGVMLPLMIGILVVGIALLVLGIVLPRRNRQEPMPIDNSNYYPPANNPPPQDTYYPPASTPPSAPPPAAPPPSTPPPPPQSG
ncbi:MAG: hypothetical protein PHG35_02655 [Dehalococcoidales bacterium]|nr:hypothetical protein [Dehalococcoidales bacterium]